MPIISSEQNLVLAFRNIKTNKGSMTTGTNNHTIEYWMKRPQEEYIRYMQDRLKNYTPMAVRRVEIPKPNGKTRPLGIPSMEDRLLQQAIKQVLEPICEAKFYTYSYGFRPNRSAENAIGIFSHRINMSHCRYVVDIDIKGFFDNVHHGKLLKQIWAMGIRDKHLLCIISKMLKAPIHDGNNIIVPVKGTPQGGILSPLLSNIVLNELDWWIHSQWLGFTHIYKTKFKKNSSRYGKLRRTNLKEMYIVRYADDFKILCKKKKDAVKIYHATKQWLWDRLRLEVSDEKSGITDIHKMSSEFLGFSLKAHNKGKGNYSVQSHICDKAKRQIKQTISKRIKDMQKHPTAKNVALYNSTIAGIQNYYQIATQINLDCSKLSYQLSKKLKVRIKSIENKSGFITQDYEKRYKNNYKKRFVAGLILYPLADIQTRFPMLYSDKINMYTEEGREEMHKRIYVSSRILKYLITNPPENQSLLFYDNRISLFAGQLGMCRITHDKLEIGNMEVHHIKPKSKGGTDKYRNLIYVTSPVHDLIHTVNPLNLRSETMETLHVILNDEPMLKTFNKYRNLAGRPSIIKSADGSWEVEASRTESLALILEGEEGFDEFMEEAKEAEKKMETKKKTKFFGSKT